MTAASRLVPDLLDEIGAIVRPALRRYLPDREPRRHLYAPLADYPARGGRMMRPALCIATARAFGGTLDDALPCAISIEMLHNALLVHDDIEDESEERRGRPTLHVLHGVPIAINVGDALALGSLRPLIDQRETLGPALTLRLIEEVDRMARETAEGQALELGWRFDNTPDVSEADYLEMVLKKTCWLATIHPCRTGALIGTRGAVDPERFLRFGFFVGAAFQIQDDLLNLVGDEARYGKELLGDLFEGKRTLMLIHTLRGSDPEDAARILALLGAPRADRAEAEVRWLRRRMDRHGSIEYARAVAHGLAGAALHEFERAFAGLPESRDKAFVEALCTWVFERA